jgi:hypothetical protein
VCAITFADCEKKKEIIYLEAFKNNFGFVDENGKFI